MTRYLAIQSVTFDQVQLALPRSVRLMRSALPALAGADTALLATSLELSGQSLGAEVVVRDTAAAELLQLGRQGLLNIVLPPDDADSPARSLSIDDAVLVGVELAYSQAAPAEATLRFCALSPDGLSEPFIPEEIA